MPDFFIQPLSCSAPLQTYYQALSHLPGFALLESGRNTRGRFDILSAFPYDQLTETKPEKGIFEQLQQKLPIMPSSIDLPFQGGALGYFSYETGARLLDVPSAGRSQFTHLPAVQIGLYDWAIIVDHVDKKITLFAANLQPVTMRHIREILHIWNHVEQKPVDLTPHSPFQSLISKNAYRETFEQIQTYLKSGRCYQVNYTQPFEAHYAGDAFALYQRIMMHNPVPFGAFLQLEKAQVLSFSPERFLSFHQGFLSASPIKGTARSADCAIEDAQIQAQLQQCPKNRAENVMIVDLWRNDLGQIAKPGSVQVPSLFEIQSFRGLHHLVSTIEAECLESIHPVQAFKKCFPGGSITGTPKKEAMHIIQELEPYTRGIYCGSIAWFSNHGRFDSNIAIRTMVLEDARLHLAAGGAIVVDSLWEEEYEECFTKIRGMQVVE